MKKLRPSDGSSKKAKINLVKVAGENLYRVDDELSQLQKKLMKRTGKKKGLRKEMQSTDLNAYGVMKNMNQKGAQKKG